MNWKEVERSLRDDCKRLRAEAARLGTTQAAMVGGAALVIGLLAEALAQGADRPGEER